MSNNLIELSRTPDSIYYCLELPKGAERIEIFPSIRSLSKCYLIYDLEGEETLPIVIAYKAKLLGTLDTLTVDQAREIVKQTLNYFNRNEGYRFYDYLSNEIECKTALESLTSLIESKGVNTKENLIPIIKVKL